MCIRDRTKVCRVLEYILGHGELAQSAIFNVGSGESQSVFAMAQLIQQRCIAVLGFKPLLLRVEGGPDEIHPMLNYRAVNLASLGMKDNSNDYTAEIDNLLHFCQTSFSYSQSSKA